jgi:hypothetical protein
MPAALRNLSVDLSAGRKQRPRCRKRETDIIPEHHLLPFVTSVMAVLPKDKLGAPKDEILNALTYADLGEHGRDPVYGRGPLLARAACTPPNETVASAAR